MESDAEQPACNDMHDRHTGLRINQIQANGQQKQPQAKLGPECQPAEAERAATMQAMADKK